MSESINQDRKVRQFSLSPTFLAEFEGRQPAWGPVGYFTFKRCVDRSTPVLCDDLQWRPAGDLKEGQGIVGFDADPTDTMFRYIRHGVVLHNKVEKAQTFGIELEDGTVLYATPDHGWLVKLSETDNRLYWKETKDLAMTAKGGAVHLLRPFGVPWEKANTYEDGFLAAAFDGEGCLDDTDGLTFTQVENAMLHQVEGFLDQRNVPFTKRPKSKVDGRQQVYTLLTTGRRNIYSLIGAIQPPRLIEVFRAHLKEKGGGALRTSREDAVRVVRVFDAGERDIAVLSTSTETHFTGGFASHNTYARPTCDCEDPRSCGHSSEEFWETCRRVVEGVYNVQKAHCRRLSLPWNEPKAQVSAQEMFRRMWEFKWTPPGRGLWMMGTPFMLQKGGACINNCFAPETKAWVQQGGFDGPRLATLGELAGFSGGERAITILAGDGQMRPATARSFGVQKLVRVSFAPTGFRSNYRLEYDVTPTHRWLLADGSETTALKVGDRVKITPAGYFGSDDQAEIEGFAHGLVFGDGARHTYYTYRHQIRLCGEKERVHLARLEQSAYHSNTTYPESYNGDAMVWFNLNDGMNWKALPCENSSAAYQRAFLLGWMAADATKKPAGTKALNTQNPEAAQWAVERAPLLGFCVTGFNYDSVMETNYGPRSAPMARITLTTEATEYTVKSITDEGREEEVFCVTEPETGTFTLEGGLVTGNCAFVSSEHLDEDFAGPFTFLMDMSMLGVGVGGDTRGVGKVKIQTPKMGDPFIVADSREGWVALARAVINSFVGKGTFPVSIDFSAVRPKGKRIRGFGGTASGAGPLNKLVKNVARTLAPEGVQVVFEESLSPETGEVATLQTYFVGEGKPYKIGTSHITDVFNMVGACVVAGGVRRSAEIMFGQPDDTEFRTLKDPTTLWPLDKRMSEIQADLSMTTDAVVVARLQAEAAELEGRINAHPLRSHRWASNNSIFGEVGMDYSEVAKSIAKNGEPGILWLKNAQDFSRMKDAPDRKDRRAQGANPCVEQTLESYELCVGGNTRLTTRKGAPLIQDMVGKTVDVWNGVAWSSVIPFITGQERSLFRVHLSDGSYLDCTDNHKWEVLPNGKRTFREVETKDLVLGSQVMPFNINLPCEGEALPCAYEWGFFTGDGFLDNAQVMTKLHGASDRKLEGVLRGKVYTEQHPEGYAEPFVRVNFTGNFREIFPEDYLNRARDLNNKALGLPDWLFSLDRESTLRFIAGWIDSDGTLNKQVDTDNYTVYGTEAKIRDLQMLLRRVGVNHASVFLNAEAGQELVINGRTTVRNHDLWVCLIPSYEGEEISRYCHLKVARRFGSRYAPNNAHPEGAPIDRARKQKVVDIEELPGKHTTYCFDEPERHMAVFNNVLTHQCTLVETYPAHHDSYEDFQKTLKVAYLYAKTVTLIPTHDPRSNAVMNRNRRIGCSMSGIRQAIEKVGRREFLNWCDRGFSYIHGLDTIYSEWLGIPLSIKTTSVKPSGCRPWYALTSTNKGLLTLEDLFENHPADQAWAKQPDHDLEAIGTGIISKTFNNGVSPVLRIITSYGIEVESTPNHQWWVTQRYDRKKSEKYQDVNEWRRADEIQPGDILDIKLGVYNMEGGVDLVPLNSLALNMRGDATEIRQPKRMNPRLAWLLGYLWGDGAMSPSKYRLRWVDARRENLLKAQAVLKEQFGLDAAIQQASEHRKAETLEVGSKHLWHWLIRNDVFKLYADKINIIPKVVRASGQEEILAFLAGLLDSDGWAGLTEQGAKLVWTTADEFFARHVQDVALAVGLVLGRSHIVGGESFQNRRSMWHLTQSAHVDPRAFEMFRRHSTKVADVEARPDFFGWHCDPPPHLEDKMTSGRLILGKVLKVEPVGEMPTFDVEVYGDFHWYYAGAVKSHNTVSLLCGATPGIHPPHSPFYIRNIRVAGTSPLCQAARDAGYKVEKDAYADDTWVISFPVKTSCSKGKRDVSIWEQVALAADMQRHWADNQVSVTVTFTPEEAAEIETVLEVFEDRLKSISFLPLGDDHGYVQAPYIEITEAEYNVMAARIRPMVMDVVKTEAEDKFCDGGVCEIDFSKSQGA